MWLDATGDPWVRGGFCGRINGNPEVAMAVELVDEYRKSELRLRLLLMGDGSESPGAGEGRRAPTKRGPGDPIAYARRLRRWSRIGMPLGRLMGSMMSSA